MQRQLYASAASTALTKLLLVFAAFGCPLFVRCACGCIRHNVSSSDYWTAVPDVFTVSLRGYGVTNVGRPSYAYWQIQICYSPRVWCNNVGRPSYAYRQIYRLFSEGMV